MPTESRSFLETPDNYPRTSMALPVALYIPNLLGYLRIILAFVGIWYASAEPGKALVIWIFSASLDLIDGILARKLQQTSSLGVLLDIAADNILRTVSWVAAAMASVSNDSGTGDSRWVVLAACLLISLEWTTMVCTQLHTTQSGNHWKGSREKDPWLIQAIFANGFKTPLGSLCVYGLFGSSLFAFGTNYQHICDIVPYIRFWEYSCYTGRAISLLAEVWLVLSYISLVIEKDTEAARTKQP